MPLSVMAKLFEEFTQADASTAVAPAVPVEGTRRGDRRVQTPQPPIPDYTDEEIVYHLRIMEDGGLISYNLGTFTLSRSAALDRSAVCICATDRGTPRRQAPETVFM